MTIKPIKTETDYRGALEEIEGLMYAKPDTPEDDMHDVLSMLVEAYERKAYPWNSLIPIKVINFYME